MGEELNGFNGEDIPMVVHSIGFSFVTTAELLVDRQVLVKPRKTLNGLDPTDKVQSFRYSTDEWSLPLRLSPDSSTFDNLSCVDSGITPDEPIDLVLGSYGLLNMDPGAPDWSLSLRVEPIVFLYNSSREDFHRFLKEQLDNLFDSTMVESMDEPYDFQNTLTYHAYAIALVKDLNKVSLREDERVGDRLAIIRRLGMIGPTKSCYERGSRSFQSVVYLLECPNVVESVLDDGMFPKDDLTNVSDFLQQVCSQERAITLYYESLLLMMSIAWIDEECRKALQRIPKGLGEQEFNSILEVSDDLIEVKIAQSFVRHFLGFRNDAMMPTLDIVDHWVPFSYVKEFSNNTSTKLQMIQNNIDRKISVAKIRAERGRQAEQKRREIKFNKLQISVTFLVAFEVVAAFLSWAITTLEITFLQGVIYWALLIVIMAIVFAYSYAQMT